MTGIVSVSPSSGPGGTLESEDDNEQCIRSDGPCEVLFEALSLDYPGNLP